MPPYDPSFRRQLESDELYSGVGEALSNLAASRISASAAADDDDLELYGNVPAPGNVGQLGRGSPTSDRDSYGSVPSKSHLQQKKNKSESEKVRK